MNLQLIMQEPPDSPQEVKVLEADGRSATISWSPPFSGNSPITNYVIQYKPDNVTTYTNVTISGNENYLSIRGLKPVSKYHARVVAVNMLGKSDSSEVTLITTDEEGKFMQRSMSVSNSLFV